MAKMSATLAVTLIATASVAYGQSSAPANKDGTKPRPDPQPFYQPYTGPGFGNPDANAKPEQPVGRSRKKYNDPAGASAYSRGGNTEATPLNAAPKAKPGKKEKAAEKAKTGAETSDPAAASPKVSEKR